MNTPPTNPSRHRDALVVMARRPVPGRVKTRLAEHVGGEAAADLYADLLTDTLDRAARLTQASLYLALEPESGLGDDAPADRTETGIDALLAPLRAAGWSVLEQQGEGLGARLAAVFAELFAAGHETVSIIGSDSPALPGAFLERAFALLQRDTVDGPGEAVLGPAFDGGYYLIALSHRAWRGREQNLTRLLEDTPMGTPEAARHTARRLADLGLTMSTLPSWVDVDTAGDAALAAALALSAPRRGGSLDRLREVYLHVTHRCSTGCPQCYLTDVRDDGVGSSGELDTAVWRRVIDEAAELGAERFVFIGGDPFLRPDLLDLIDHVTGVHRAAARLFFNRPIRPETAAALAEVGRGRLVPLVSVDGPREANDSLRGPGNFDAALASFRALLGAGLRPVANTVLLRPVLPGLPSLVRTLAAENVPTIHLILPHARGGLAEAADLVPAGKELLRAFDDVERAAAEVGLAIDNLAGWNGRLRSPRDLCSAGCSQLAVDPDGLVHACPITCGDRAFVAGDVREQSLASIWRGSPVLDLLRATHARDREACEGCPVVDACGGECWVQAHYAAVARGDRAGYLAQFPYCDFVRPVLERLGAGGGGRAADGLGAREAAADGSPVDLTPFDCI